MSESEPYLRIRNLTKKFGEFVALSEVSLDVEEGEFVCFLGPSGCGKTTLLRAIAGLDIQTYGSVEQGSRDVSSLPPAERDFGIVFQSYALFPNLSIERNIAYGLENLGQSKDQIQTRVGELLALIGMPEQGKKYPAQLSGGQQQRVALARALAISPGLLLLDEPLSALDAQVRVNLRKEIKALQHQLGVTTIMVTHDQEEALTMADRIVVINKGVIEQVGTPEEIYGQPATQFVASFIGAMNFVPVTNAGDHSVSMGDVVFSCDQPAPEQASGNQLIAAIRPEDIQVVDDSANTVAVQVASVEFLGPYVRAGLVAESLGENVIYADFSANLVRRKNLAQGSQLTVCLPSQSIRLYPA